MRTADWTAPYRRSAADAMAGVGSDAWPIGGLPLVGRSFDFGASNLVFGPKPTLVDPDHAARMPGLYDRAVALLLFHCDLPKAPGRPWTGGKGADFLRGYVGHVALSDAERSAWPAVLSLAWLDRGVWLLGNWPDGWADPRGRAYLLDVAAFDPGGFALPVPPEAASRGSGGGPSGPAPVRVRA